MIFINETGIIGTILAAGTQTLTGNIVASLLLILLILIAVSMMFAIPLELIAVILLPLCIGMGAYYSNLLAPLIVILIYISMIIAKNWLFR